MIKPITPSEVVEQKKKDLPPEVIETWNKLIAEKFSGSSARVLQKDAVSALTIALLVPSSVIFDKGYLDVEPIYRDAGWKVEYDKPGYNESYEAFYIFQKKRGE